MQLATNALKHLYEERRSAHTLEIAMQYKEYELLDSLEDDWLDIGDLRGETVP